MDRMENQSWHAIDYQAVFEKLETTPEGLSTDTVAQRFKYFGLNLIKSNPSETIPQIFLHQLANPLVYVLILSTLLALALGKFIDGFVVFAVIILNTLIGFTQEYRASNIIRSLSKMLPDEATVKRQGVTKTIPAAEIVPGDIICLQGGDKIPADLRLFFIKGLACDESCLTGESLPVFKRTEKVSNTTPLAERNCLAFSGTFVTAGTAMGIATATGSFTELGKISTLIESETSLEVPLTIALKQIARWISMGVLIAGLMLFAVGYLRGNPIFDSILAAVTLGVAAIPEGLPAIITIASAIGVRRMAYNKAIIRQLPAVETLGSTSVICTDKTGTLTHNELTIQKIWTSSGFTFVTGAGFSLEGQVVSFNGASSHEKKMNDEVLPLIKALIICSDASLNYTPNGWNIVGDPTEVALTVLGRKVHLNETTVREEWKRKDAVPFESERRLMATLNTSSQNKPYIFLKGAPEEILMRCFPEQFDLQNLTKIINEMAADGMRVLAAAKKEVPESLQTLDESEIEGQFTFIGLVGMVDPTRKEAYEAIKTCHQAGIIVKMITGDHPATAKSIALDLGIVEKDQSAISGAELDKLDANEWNEAALAFNVFARTSPEHKLKLIQALQESEHVVAMTGDGVNDGPALKKADIGIAMGIKGTAVAKEAADMILTDDNFDNIQHAVREGRRVYDNIIKALTFVLPTSLGQALIILIAMVCFPMNHGTILHPIMPIQILWINLIVAVGLSLPLAFESPEPNIMKRPPRRKSSPLLSRFLVIRTFIVSILMAVGTIAMFLWKYRFEISNGTDERTALAEAQTMAVTFIVILQVFYLFNCRSSSMDFLKKSFLDNPFILFSAGTVIAAQLGFIYLPFMNTLFGSFPINAETWLLSIGGALGLSWIITCSHRCLPSTSS